ncbi:Pantoate--beta-alanine ligase [Corynebacterium camporealensis]|uniref:pantoate--beta-alanine ligase (AMP-forming) n=1 Tax=Corynebacterium camporealensis TaxID=161896 RepID=A0A0F6TC29_9CORY|nr:pantoate--beta-alanine ligase [Corynebacterium camporealensis]AKE39939.1 panthothenate synthetase [Corynebacterium camporealensis]AVH89034.1 Pantoate--beta-alanine ligase [Corynebacterium camporealensis]
MIQPPLIDDIQRIGMVGSAFAKKGKPVVLVPLGEGVHAGHINLVRAARRIRGGIVVVALSSTDEQDAQALIEENVDFIWQYTTDDLFPRGQRTQVVPDDFGMETDLAAPLTQLVAMLGAVRPSDIVVGEKDYELLIALQQAVVDLHLGVRVQGVPTVRTPEGVAMSLRNTHVPTDAREAASALSAALTAGAYAAEEGAEKVLETARAVLDAAGVEPEYLELRGRDLGEAPEEGDARLLVAATFGDVRLIDNAGLPLGIGFRNIDGS